MKLPRRIPKGARIVVRVIAGLDQYDQRMKFNDYIGHVESWDGTVLVLHRDPSGNGNRPAQMVSIPAESIIRLKPISERRYPIRHHDGAEVT